MFAPAKALRVRRGTSIRPGFRPTLDTFEARQLMTVAPFLQGTVFNDSNSNGQLDTTETPLAGATIDLYASNSTTKLASTTSGADGGYLFNSSNVTGGLTVGATYNLVESASGYTNTGAQALSTVNTASVTAPNAIQVTIVDPNKVSAAFTSPTSYGNPPYDGIGYTLNGTASTTNPTQLNFTLSGDPNLTNGSITTLCVGLRDQLSFNAPFATGVVSQTALPNGGQIGYLYNHYGLTTLSSTTTVPSSIQGLSLKNLAAGLQLAVWELEYGSSLAVTGYDTNYTTKDEYKDLQTAAAAFIADSTGKSEKIAVLDASLSGQLPTPTATPGGQSILAALSYNFGNKLTPILKGGLSGVVYADSNNNGVLDAGEKGISGTSVTLNTLVNGTVTPVSSTTSGADGSYSFANLAPGTYSVTEGAVTGYLPSSTNTGSINGITVIAGATNPNNNFGEILPGTVSGVVYADSNNNGSKDRVEKGIGSVPISLTTTVNGVTTTVASANTNPDGSYSFSNLAPGTYTVVEGVVTGYLPSSTNTGSIAGVTVVQGGTNPNNNFGEILPGAVSGVVYYDSNNNGAKDSGEKGIGSVPITLTSVVNGKTVTVGTATTNADGSYSFSNLAPGTYTVVEGVVTGYLPSSTNTGSIAGVTVVQGGTNPNNNFGEVLFKPGSISGVVFADKTGDGFSNDDKPLAGVTVQLLNSAGTVIASQKVGTTGAYAFSNLAPGTYTVQEVVPSGYVQTAPGSLVYTVPLVSGQVVTGDDFDNYQVDCNSCSISNISYTDITGCGVQCFTDLGGNTNQGDQVTAKFYVGGKSPVTVSFVTYTATSNFDLTKQSIFDVDTETFTPGWHTLTVTIPNSYYQIDLVCGGAISQFIPSANATYHGEGRYIDSDNGGCENVPAAFSSLSGSVFNDCDYDGNFDSSESGLGGVTVKLTGKDVNGQYVSLTRITGSDGSYNFNGLQAGTYKVSEVTPSGYFTTKNSVGTINGTTVGSLGSDNISGVTLTGGKSGVNYNFGEQTTGDKLGCNQTASAGYWNGCSGQSLIKSLNGSSNSTKLGNWLATAFPNSLSCLAGKTNAQVAAYYQSSYNQCRSSSLTEGLATAFAVYATDSGLAGGNYASCYGFKVTCAGAGAATIDVGSTFSCYGGPTGKVSLLQLLQYADANASNCDAWFQYRLACVFDYVNGCGNY